MSKFLILLLATVLSLPVRQALAQVDDRLDPAGPKHILTVFAQEGEKFFLVLDGQRQNDKPLARVTVKELDRPYYKAKILFDNEKLPSVDANLQLVGVDPGANDVTYVVRRKTGKKSGTYVVRSYSFIARGGTPTSEPTPTSGAQPGYIPSNASQDPNYQPGLPQPGAPTPPAVQMGEPYGQPTQVVINIPGGPLQLETPPAPKKADPALNTVTTQGQPIRPATTPCATPMAEQAFTKMKSSISGQSFEDKKLGIARVAIRSACLSTDQVKAIIGLFNFEDNRITFAKEAYSKTVDKDQYYTVSEVFKFSSSTDELNAFLSER